VIKLKLRSIRKYVVATTINNVKISFKLIDG
jgi:hypothetical protein